MCLVKLLVFRCVELLMGTTCASYLLSLKWEASKFMENQNHTEGLLKHRLLGSHPQRCWFSWSRVAFENLHFSQATCDVNAAGAQEDNPRSFVKCWFLGPPPGFWFNWSGWGLDVRIVKDPRWFARTGQTENHWGLWEKRQIWLRFFGSEEFLGFHGQSVNLPRWGLPGSRSLRVEGKLSFASHTSKPISLKPSQLFADDGINVFLDLNLPDSLDFCISLFTGSCGPPVVTHSRNFDHGSH